jgi:PmbA protein
VITPNTYGPGPTVNGGTSFFEGLADGIVKAALLRGATDAECTLLDSHTFAVKVRLGRIESLKDAGSRTALLRVLVGKRSGSSYTSDFSPGGLELMVRSALDIAPMSTEDAYADLPDRDEQRIPPADLQIFSPAFAGQSTTERIALAMAAEKSALKRDERITNSDGASFSSQIGMHAYANSRGFSGCYRHGSCSLHVVAVARDGDRLERDYWYSAGRFLEQLEPASAIGEKAADRVLRRLGARKIATQKTCVIFDPQAARFLVNGLFNAVKGNAIYRRASFLADKLGQKIASQSVTLVDDSTIPGLLGSAPFDGEGIPTRRTTIIDRGVLTNYLLNTYSARKLGLRTTGNALRLLSGDVTIGHGNLFVTAGRQSPAELIGNVRRGLYVTELIGSGVNVITGYYSQGAAGLWIEDGKVCFPVSEVTIAGRVQDMLTSLQPASDLDFRSSIASPTLLVHEMTVSAR